MSVAMIPVTEPLRRRQTPEQTATDQSRWWRVWGIPMQRSRFMHDLGLVYGTASEANHVGYYRTFCSHSYPMRWFFLQEVKHGC